jgi:hypothetical protein
MEFWPSTDQAYPIAVFAIANQPRLTQDADRFCIDDTLVSIVGTASLKAHYRQPDAGIWETKVTNLLFALKAKSWGVPAREITVSNSTLTHKSGKRASFGDMASAAAKLPLPKEVKLKDPAKFALIGKESTRRLDSQAKSTGTAIFTGDVRLPGMLHAIVVRRAERR